MFLLFQIRTDVICATYLWQVDRKYFPEFQYCAMEKGRDTCDGDSGSPLIKEFNKNWYLVGFINNLESLEQHIRLCIVRRNNNYSCE